MENVLFKNERYSGQYVAIKSIEDPKVISSGADPALVHEEASKKIRGEFLLLFVPEKDLVHIY